MGRATLAVPLCTLRATSRQPAQYDNGFTESPWAAPLRCALLIDLDVLAQRTAVCALWAGRGAGRGCGAVRGLAHTAHQHAMAHSRMRMRGGPRSAVGRALERVSNLLLSELFASTLASRLSRSRARRRPPAGGVEVRSLCARGRVGGVVATHDPRPTTGGPRAPPGANSV